MSSSSSFTNSDDVLPIISESVMKRYKVLILGSACVGKTALLKMIKTSVFEMKYIATMGVEVSGLKFETTTKDTKDTVFNMSDCAGQEKFSGL
jgi:GTPase SAR1 family protein